MIASPTARLARLLAWFLPSVCLASLTHAQIPGSVAGEQKIAHGVGTFPAQLSDGDEFGGALVSLADIDSNGIVELVVGAPGDDDGALDAGAVWVLYFDPLGVIINWQKISSTAGGFPGSLLAGDRFGSSLAALGDVDGDGVDDIAIGAPGSDLGGPDRGSIWILNLNVNGTVKAATQYSDSTGSSFLSDGDAFGCSVATVNDMDSDGVAELVVGASGDDDGGLDRGAVYLLYLDATGAIKSRTKVSQVSGGFIGTIGDGDRFGSSVASNPSAAAGTAALAVGAPFDDTTGTDRGSVWILLLDAQGDVKGTKKIDGLFGVAVSDGDQFGASVTFPGDINDDGIDDLVVGAPFDDDGGADRGSAHAVFLNTNGTIRGTTKVSSTSGLFGGVLSNNDRFGSSICSPGDLNNDGFEDIVVGASFDDTGGQDRGALWATWLNGCPGASHVVRNGSGVNPLRLDGAGVPSFQSNWDALVDCSGMGSGVIALIGAKDPGQGVFIRAGEILIDLSSSLYFVFRAPHTGGVEAFSFGIPSDPAFCSFRVHMQALVTGVGQAELSNALDWTVGR